MRIPRRASMALATFVLAATTGHVMQNGVDYAARLRGQPAIAPVADAVGASALAGAVITPLRADTAASLPLPDLPVAIVPRLATGPHIAAPPRADAALPGTVVRHNDLDLSPFGLSCQAPSLVAVARPGGLLAVTLTASCNPSEPVTIRHGGLSITGRTSTAGLLSVDLPALAPVARVVAELASGAGAETDTEVPGIAGLTRVVLSHDRAIPLRLSGNAPGSDLRTIRNADAQAEIYSASALVPSDRLAIEAEVTAQSCGRTIEASLLVGSGTPIPVQIAMPGCDALGDRVVLRLDLPAPLVVAGH